MCLEVCRLRSSFFLFKNLFRIRIPAFKIVEAVKHELTKEIMLTSPYFSVQIKPGWNHSDANPSNVYKFFKKGPSLICHGMHMFLSKKMAEVMVGSTIYENVLPVFFLKKDFLGTGHWSHAAATSFYVDEGDYIKLIRSIPQNKARTVDEKEWQLLESGGMLKED